MPKPTLAQVAWNAQTSIYQVYETQEATTLSALDFESQAWQEWLGQRSSFAFQSKDGHRLTARNEARVRGRSYWVAYRKVGGKLTHTYLGRPVDVTLARLEQVARFLAGPDGQNAGNSPVVEQQARQEPPILVGGQETPPHAGLGSGWLRQDHPALSLGAGAPTGKSSRCLGLAR